MAVVGAVEWVNVDSDLFTAAAFRDDVRQLYLRFRDGDIYRYFDCPVSVYQGFLRAESKGRYFSQNIRNRFRYELLHHKEAYADRREHIDADLIEQLSNSVVLAKSLVIQNGDADHAAGVQP